MAALFAVWRTTVVNWSLWFAWVAWLLDLFGLAAAALFFFVIRHRAVPAPPPPNPGLTVDVLIPTVNEPIDVLEPSVLGATRIRGVRRVLVLDDGARPEVAAMARRVGADYYARSAHNGAKAGNLNFGLQYTDADLVATFDADHVPMPGFLEHTVGYFADPEIGFVQTPQAFYNTQTLTFRKRRDGRVYWYEQGMFYECVQPAKNASNSAFYTGTGALLRRAALLGIDGFADSTATEDIHTSLRLHSAGWHSVFVPRPLAYGLEVDNLREYYHTRQRWAAGSMCLLFRNPDSPARISGLTLRQRASYLSSTMAHLQGAQRGFYLILPLLALFTLSSPVSAGLWVYSGACLMIASLGFWLTHRLGYGAYRPWPSEEFNLAAVLPQLFGLEGLLGRQHKFFVSAKNAGRNSGRRAKFGFAALAALNVTALARTGQLIATDRFSALVLWSTLFVLVNTTVITHLLVTLIRYERQRTDPPYARLTPELLYGYLLRLDGQHVPGSAEPVQPPHKPGHHHSQHAAQPVQPPHPPGHHHPQHSAEPVQPPHKPGHHHPQHSAQPGHHHPLHSGEPVRTH